LPLRLVRLALPGGIADQPGGGLFVDIRIVEQTLPELERQYAPRRNVDSLDRNCAAAHAFQYRGGIIHAAKLVDACVHPLGESIGDAQRFHAPWHADRLRRLGMSRIRRHAGLRAVARDRPVGNDQAAICLFAAQQVGQHLFAEPCADRLDRLAANRGAMQRDIGRHHALARCCQRAIERADMIGK